MSMLVFEDRTQAEQMTKTLAVPPDAPVTIESVSVHEIVAHA